MPRPKLPLTPASSTDLVGQDGTKQLAALQLSFELPPPALTASDSQQQTPTEETTSQYPLQASEAVKSRRRSSAATKQFALPPPPSRTRRIIQMKPKEPDLEAALAHTAGAAIYTTEQPQPAVPDAAASGSKRKQGQPAASPAAKKIARKTAHKDIEARRRQRMNVEYDTLKDMVPACAGEKGPDKLVILKETVKYLRYLEDCKEQLEAQIGKNAETTSRDTWLADGRPHGYTRETSSDVAMAGSEVPLTTHHPRLRDAPTSPAVHPRFSHGHTREPSSSSDAAVPGSEMPSTRHHPRPQHPPASPVMDPRLRHNSNSSSPTEYRDFTYSHSTSTSPYFGPQVNQHYSGYVSALTSPALVPQRDVEHEVSSALLTLSGSDRRGSRGMSVRDLCTGLVGVLDGLGNRQ